MAFARQSPQSSSDEMAAGTGPDDVAPVSASGRRGATAALAGGVVPSRVAASTAAAPVSGTGRSLAEKPGLLASEAVSALGDARRGRLSH